MTIGVEPDHRLQERCGDLVGQRDQADLTEIEAVEGKGIVKEVPGDVKACEYCPAFNACKQKDLYYVA